MPTGLADVGRLIIVAEILAQSSGRAGGDIRKPNDRIPSAGEWLAGVELPLIFEEYFDRPAGRARTVGKPGGPTVRFVKAVMVEIGNSVAAETIVRAMTRLRDLRERRRAVRQRDRDIGQK
jgi:hypothetical protein